MTPGSAQSTTCRGGLTTRCSLTKSRHVQRRDGVQAAARAPRDRGPATVVLPSSLGLGPSQLSAKSVDMERPCKWGSRSSSLQLLSCVFMVQPTRQRSDDELDG